MDGPAGLGTAGRDEEQRVGCCSGAWDRSFELDSCTYPYDFTTYQETLSRVRTCADASVLEPDRSPRIARLMANPRGSGREDDPADPSEHYIDREASP